MKKLISAIIGTGLFLSCNAFSLTPDCGNRGYASGLCAPKYRGGFSIGVTGAAIKPSATGTALNEFIFGDDLSPTSGVLSTSDLHRFQLDDKWEWGVNVAYDLPCTAYSVEVDYFHIDSNDNRHNSTADGFASISDFFITNLFFPISATPVISETTPIIVTDFRTHSEIKFKFDNVDLKFGRQYNDVCGNFQIKPSVGVRYARIDLHNNHHFEGTLFDPLGLVGITDVVSASVDIKNHSEYDGVGPLASLDTRYGFCRGFGLVGHFNAALLVGNLKTHLSDSSVFSGTIPDETPTPFSEQDNSSWHTPSTDRVVTSLDGKVGVDYSFCFCNKSSLTFEVGYQASKYYNAIDLLRGTLAISSTLLPADDATPQQVTDSDSSDFEFRGPYVNVTWHL